ncbi:MAG: hypothetical protein AB9907_18235 [Flexilinea sp.]
MKKRIRPGFIILIIFILLFTGFEAALAAKDDFTIIKQFPELIYQYKTPTPTPTPGFVVMQLGPIIPDFEVMPVATAVPTSPPYDFGVFEAIPFEPIITPVPHYDFGVFEAIPFEPIETSLDSVTGWFPAAGSDNITTEILFVWAYETSGIELSTPSFTLSIDGGIPQAVSPTCSPGFCQVTNVLTGGAHTWRVTGTLGSDVVSSEVIPFTITPAAVLPGAPVLESPSGEYPTRSLSFYWIPASNAESYTVHWSMEGGGSGILLLSASDDSCLGAHCAISTTLPSEGKYTWYVTATNAVGSTDSSSMEFQVNPNINTPEGYFPFGDLKDPEHLTFEFSDVQDYVFEYRIKVNNSNTGEVIMDRSWNVDGFFCEEGRCSISVDLKLPTGNYYWSVRGYSETSVSHWSNALNFSMECTTCTNSGQPANYANTYPTPTYPTGIIQNNMPTFTWRTITGASTYWLTVYDSGGTILLDSVIDKINCNYDYCYYAPGFKFPGNGTYSWKISGGTSAGAVWGSASTYFSIEAPIGALRFISPENLGVISKSAPAISWTDPGISILSFNIQLWGVQQTILLNTNKPRDTSWCDGTVCTLRFSMIPEAVNYQIEITPLSAIGSTGQSARLIFNVGEVPEIQALFPAEGETVPTRPLFRWKLPESDGTSASNILYYKIRLIESGGKEVVFGPLICGESGVNCSGGEAYFIPIDALLPGNYTWSLETPQEGKATTPISILVK